MPRPRFDHPTPGELEVLKVLWEQGALSPRDVMDRLNQDGKERAYTSVASLLNVMLEKQLVSRRARGNAFVYAARASRERTLNQLVEDLVGRAFEGSASALVAHLLDARKVSREELDEIRAVIKKLER
jgi:BlaI family transcriptional regulator, penicillinase repressor